MKKTIITAIFINMITVCSLWAADLGKTDIHGFISQGYLKTDHNNYLADTEDGSFQFNEMGINFNRQINKRFKIGMQFFARDLGNVGNDEISVDWAFADYRWKDWMGLRAGILKTPLGLYNETRDIDMLRTSILLSDAIYYEGNRDSLNKTKGLSLYGSFLLNKLGMLNYRILEGTRGVDVNSGFSNYILDQFTQTFPSNTTMELTDIKFDHSRSAELQWFTPLDGLKIAYSILDMEYDVYYSFFVNNSHVFDGVSPVELVLIKIYSVEYTWQDLIVAAEYLYTTVETGGAFTNRFHGEAYYASGCYRLNEWFEFGLRYSEHFSDTDNKDGDGLTIDHRAWQKDLTLSFRFDINESWACKFEIHDINGTALLLQAENEENEIKENWHLYAAKLSFVF